MTKEEAFKERFGITPEESTPEVVRIFNIGWDAALSQQQWIPIEKELPKDYMSVLCYNDNFIVGYYDDDDEAWINPLNGDKISFVTHWQPLPPKP